MDTREPTAVCWATLIAGWIVAGIDGLQSARGADLPSVCGSVLLALIVMGPVALVLGFALRIALWLSPVEPHPRELYRRICRFLSAQGDQGRRRSAQVLATVVLAVVFFLIAYRLGLWFMLRFHNLSLAAFVLACCLLGVAAGLVLAWPRLARGTELGLGWLVDRIGFARPLGRPWFWGLTAAVAVVLWTCLQGGAAGQTLEAIRLGVVVVPAVLVVAGYLLGYALGGLKDRCRRIGALLALVVLVGLSVYGVWGTGSNRLYLDGSLALEERSWMARIPLAWSQALMDRDRDGYSTALGGGDCDDHRAEINPGAQEIPNNQIDEDCSGADLVLEAEFSRPFSTLGRADPQNEPGRHVSAEMGTGSGENGEEALAERVDPAAELRGRYNVILLMVDALRPGHLGYAGYERADISPHIDRLAARSIHFQRAYSCSNKTPSAVPPILASRWPSEMERSFDHFSRYGEGNLFLAEVLQEAGYFTAASVSHWYFRPGYGFAQGFDRWREYWVSQDRMERVPTSEQTADNAIAILEEYYQAEGGEGAEGEERPPYFLWIHFMDPHKLYIDHEGFEPYGPEPIDQYDGEIRFVDHHIGRVMAVLERFGALEQTVILFTSDHGEAFGEHSMRHHGWDLYEHQIRVPFFLYVPGLAAREFQTPVSLMDLAPTVLDLVGIEPESSFRGRSLLESLATGEEPEIVPIYAEMPLGPHNRLIRSLVWGDYKLIHHVRARRYRLFNLANDPGELNDLWGQEPEQARRMRAAYEQFLATQVDSIPAWGEQPAE
ncbi:MAG: sulfatase-like hydrolase/transferase [Bradymonadales bacterium]|nr:sulfatase-like hydrolase/transferase [Bradymonadales bacterium]